MLGPSKPWLSEKERHTLYGWCYYCDYRHDCLGCRAYFLGGWWRLLHWLRLGGFVVGGLAFLLVLAITLDPYFRFPG